MTHQHEALLINHIIRQLNNTVLPLPIYRVLFKHISNINIIRPVLHLLTYK